MRYILTAALALVLGLVLGGVFPRAEVRQLEAALERRRAPHLDRPSCVGADQPSIGRTIGCQRAQGFTVIVLRVRRDMLVALPVCSKDPFCLTYMPPVSARPGPTRS